MKFGRLVRKELVGFPPEYMQHLIFYISMKTVLRRDMEKQKSIHSLIADKTKEEVEGSGENEVDLQEAEEILASKDTNEGGLEVDDLEVDVHDGSISDEDDRDPVMCYICQENIVRAGDSVELTDCGHEFHTYCLRGWVGRDNDTCPNCRTQMSDLLHKDSELQIALSDGKLFHGKFWKLVFLHIRKVDKLFVKELTGFRNEFQAFVRKAISLMIQTRDSTNIFKKLPLVVKKLILTRNIRKLYAKMMLLRDFCRLDTLAIKKILKKRDKRVGAYTMRVVRGFQEQTFRFRALERKTGALAVLELLARALYNLLYAFNRNKDPNADILRARSWLDAIDEVATAPIKGVDPSIRTLVAGPSEPIGPAVTDITPSQDETDEPVHSREDEGDEDDSDMENNDDGVELDGEVTDLLQDNGLTSRASMSVSYSDVQDLYKSVAGIPETMGKSIVILREYKLKVSKRPGQRLLATHFLRDELRRAGNTRRNTVYDLRRRPTFMRG